MSRRRESPTASRPRASGASLLAATLLLQSAVALVSAQGSANATPWLTLSGKSPSVVARGGFSGLLPHSSNDAYQVAQLVSVPSVILWCDVQLTKDGVGICTPELKLDNSTDIDMVYPNRSSSYKVNGVLTNGWFPVDFTMKDLASVILTQGIYYRSQRFWHKFYPIQTVEGVASLKPQGLWLNVQHDIFFTQHNLSMRNYILSVSRSVVVNYISSPEVGFLRSIASRFNPKIIKLVLRFLGPNDIEPSTNQTYDSLSKNLTFIKTFASGVLIPKTYIWPMDEALYLQPHTSIVSDAHKAGLEVYASEFYNDVPLSYNYSYDPLAEYLNFVDNGDFTVDGVLSDFPVTPSEAIDCFSHLGKNASEQVKLLVISKNGASGDYPGCTDLAYDNAISDGADVIDCPVQMSKDGIPFCLSSINLIDSTNAAQSSFSGLAATIPEIQTGSGIFTFSLTWSQIQTLTPTISNPFAKYTLYRNPQYRNKGKFLTLADFLSLAKNAASLSGVLISIEHAAYLIEKQQLPIIDAVLDNLSKAGYANQTAKNVMIQSSNSSVLMTFKEKSNYERVYKIDENIRDALDSTIEDIKTFTNYVVISKSSIFPLNEKFTTNVTNVVPKLQTAKLPVYVETFSNEFVSQAWDFFSDATVEINNFVMGQQIDGVITEFPRTSARYRKNRCLNMGDNTPPYMKAVQPGGLLQLMAPSDLPPAQAPNPMLRESDVTEAPLPPLTERSPSPGGETTPPGSRPSGQPKIATCIFMSQLAVLYTILFLI